MWKESCYAPRFIRKTENLLNLHFLPASMMPERLCFLLTLKDIGDGCRESHCRIKTLVWGLLSFNSNFDI